MLVTLCLSVLSRVALFAASPLRYGGGRNLLSHSHMRPSGTNRLSEREQILLLRRCGGDSDMFVHSQQSLLQIDYIYRLQKTQCRVACKRAPKTRAATWGDAVRAFLSFAVPRPTVDELATLLRGSDNALPRAMAFWNDIAAPSRAGLSSQERRIPRLVRKEPPAQQL